MPSRINTLLVSFLAPGLGYLNKGNLKSFYSTVSIFFGVLITFVSSRLITVFWGFAFVVISLPLIYLFTGIHAMVQEKSSNSVKSKYPWLKFIFTTCFLLVMGISFANRRLVMGFDIMSMEVSVMQPAIYTGERFLVDTWSYDNALPKRGDIVAHSFEAQKGIYLNRIIAVEGDRIEISNSSVFLNGDKLFEIYVLPDNFKDPASGMMKQLIIPKGYYFVMGDNRDISLGDSRFNGPIPFGHIIGKLTDIISSSDNSRIGRRVK